MLDTNKNRVHHNVSRVICVIFALSILMTMPGPYAVATSTSVGNKVTFNAGGGKPAPGVQTIETGALVDVPTPPTKTGYLFAGWYTDAKKTNLFNFTQGIEKSITLYAQWEKQPTVSFAVSGGKPVPKKETVVKGERLQQLPEVAKTGYAFAGWYIDAKFEKSYAATTAIEESITLYAKWNKIPTAIFSAGGGKPVPAKQIVTVGSTVTIPEPPVKAGYVFAGWYTDSKKTQLYDFSTPVEGNVKILAKWIKTPTLSFSAGGGKPVPPIQTIQPGEKPTRPNDPVKAGYTFDGWYTSSKQTAAFDFNKAIDEKAIAYAKWIKDPVVTFSTKGKSTAPAKQTLAVGALVTEPKVVAPEGYELVGWCTDSACNNPFDFSTPVESKLTLYADWERTASLTVSKK